MARSIRWRAAVVLVVSMAGLSCRDAVPPGATGVSAPPPRPVLRAAPAPAFSAAEARMIETVGSFYEALLAALQDPALASGDADRCAARLSAELAPVHGAARELATSHAALPAARRLVIHQEAFRRHHAQVSALIEAAARWTGRFRSPDEQPQFRRITERVLGPWAHDGSLWVAAGFGPDAVEELERWATGRGERDGDRS